MIQVFKIVNRLDDRTGDIFYKSGIAANLTHLCTRSYIGRVTWGIE